MPLALASINTQRMSQGPGKDGPLHSSRARAFGPGSSAVSVHLLRQIVVERHGKDPRFVRETDRPRHTEGG
jgi:hypothetical protein